MAVDTVYSVTTQTPSMPSCMQASEPVPCECRGDAILSDCKVIDRYVYQYVLLCTHFSRVIMIIADAHVQAGSHLYF